MSSGKLASDTPSPAGKEKFNFSIDQSLTFHSTAKNTGYLVEHYHLQSLLRRYDDYQKVKSSWELPLGLFTTSLIGSLGTKFQLLGVSIETAFTWVLYTLTVVTFIWFGLSLKNLIKAYFDKNSLKSFNEVMECLKSDIEGNN